MPEMTVRHAVSLLVRQARERTRRRWGEIFGSVLLLAMTGFVLFGILDYSGAFLRPVSLTVTAAVYTPAGEPAGETTVTMEGERQILGDQSFVGRFAIEAVEGTCREGVTAQIQWDAMDVEGFQDILYCRSGEFLTLGVERLLYITESMESFGLRLEDGTLIATDESYVPLLILGLSLRYPSGVLQPILNKAAHPRGCAACLRFRIGVRPAFPRAFGRWRPRISRCPQRWSGSPPPPGPPDPRSSHRSPASPERRTPAPRQTA